MDGRFVRTQVAIDGTIRTPGPVATPACQLSPFSSAN
jgi:hypothetical protein